MGYQGLNLSWLHARPTPPLLFCSFGPQNNVLFLPSSFICYNAFESLPCCCIYQCAVFLLLLKSILLHEWSTVYLFIMHLRDVMPCFALLWKSHSKKYRGFM